jgi:pimeloyl-ACP methyl ester carboxylesterase
MDATYDAERRKELWGLLGDLPPRNHPITVKQFSREARDGYVLETLELDLNGIERVPAYFAKPDGASGKLPTVLFNHSHGGDYTIGKEEFVAGRQYLENPPYAKQLTSMGYSALCIDHWAFGGRRGRTESSLFKHMLWSGQVMWGMMVYDSVRALDYLLTRDDVDPARIGSLGISMGSTMAWWHAALDERVKVCVDLCCLTDFQALVEIDNLDGHGVYYYVPGLLKRFTTAQVNALVAPRPHLSTAGLQDKLTPPQGLDRVDAELKRVYAQWNAPDAWKLLRYDHGHRENPEMRKEIVTWLKRWL